MLHPMRVRTLIATTCLCLFVALAAVQPAFGVAPPLEQQLVNESFETSPSAAYTIEPWTTTSDLPPAWWGIHDSWAVRSGSKGLWCAGSVTTATVYPAGTGGFVTFELPQLADYYSSRVSFWYVKPSAGVTEAATLEKALNMWWDNGPKWEQPQYVPFTNSWVQQTYELSRPQNEVNLSRRAGAFTFQFTSDADLKITGRGPSIDDVVVTAYKYGPVRSLTATGSGENTQLDWATPHTSTASTADDTRTITYRVWRAPSDSESWEELTSSGSRVAATTYLDTSRTPGTQYKYLVQAWDTGSGDGHGELAASVVWPTSASLPLATLGAPSVPSGTLYRWRAITTTGTFETTHAATTVQIETSRDAVTVVDTFTADLAAGPGVYSVSGVSLPADGTWYLRARHADATHRASYSTWTTVTVNGALVLTKPKSATTMKLNKTYSVYGTVTPVHTKATYFKVRAYRLSGGSYKYVKSFSVTLTTAGQPADTAKYKASVKLTKKGSWKLKGRHYAHGAEPEVYSAYGSKITVK